MKRDIVITWPKGQPLRDYLRACREAQARGDVINYRVANAPGFDFGAHRERRGRVYVVHDGAIRGYQELLYTTYREADEVLAADGRSFWPAGNYLVRDPQWHAVEPPIPMRGFQGWRWYQADT
jgi:hypothetical protein